jgi:hypothetical protein
MSSVVMSHLQSGLSVFIVGFSDDDSICTID